MPRSRSLLALIVVLAVAAAGGVAFAHGHATAPKAKRDAAGPVSVAARYIGVTPRTLLGELRTGKSLAQVATARGKSVEGLKQALVTALRTRIDARVAAGRLSAERAARLRERAPERIERLVNATRLARHRTHARGGILLAAARYIGLAPRELFAELRAGRSLADVATARGRSLEGLKQVVLEALRTRVTAAVAAGRLTQERADRMVARAPAHVDRLVTRERR